MFLKILQKSQENICASAFLSNVADLSLTSHTAFNCPSSLTSTLVLKYVQALGHQVEVGNQKDKWKSNKSIEEYRSNFDNVLFRQ